MLKVTRFLSLFLMALATGVAFSHLLQVPPRALLSGGAFLDARQILAESYGTALAAVEWGTLLCALVSALLLRRNPACCLLTVIGTFCVAAMLLVRAVGIAPIDHQITQWGSATLPPAWTALRDQWAFFQTVRAFLAGMGLSALILSLLLETSFSSRATAQWPEGGV